MKSYLALSPYGIDTVNPYSTKAVKHLSSVRLPIVLVFINSDNSIKEVRVVYGYSSGQISSE